MAGIFRLGNEMILLKPTLGIAKCSLPGREQNLYPLGCQSPSQNRMEGDMRNQGMAYFLNNLRRHERRNINMIIKGFSDGDALNYKIQAPQFGRKDNKSSGLIRKYSTKYHIDNLVLNLSDHSIKGSKN